MGAFLLRAPDLDRRPLHTDEAVHAVKAGILMDTGAYIYDAREYHGPTLYYPAIPLVWLTGARQFAEIESAAPFRMTTVLFGVLLVFLLFGLRDGLGQRAAVLAGILTAVSPAMVYYSRYYIQEMLLVCFTFAAFVFAWRYTRRRRIGWALLAGAAIGLMHATKETSVLAWAALVLAVLLTVAWTRWVDGRHLHLPDYFHHWHALGALKVAAVIAVLCLTALLSNPSATWDSIATYFAYVQRAGTGDSSTHGASLHTHPWTFYFERLFWFQDGPRPRWSEALIGILSVTGFAKALRRRAPVCEANVHLLRVIAFYTLALMVLYCAIPYKTPWCLLGFHHGLILMAGAGTVAVIGWLPRRWMRAAAVLLLALGVAHLAKQAWSASYVYPADSRNPYVYAHTSTDLLNLVRRIEDLAAVHPEGRNLVVQVMVPKSDYWPLPWYLRGFPRVGYTDEVPERIAADVVIAGLELEDAVAAQLGEGYFTEYFGLRSGVLLEVHIRQPLWDAFIKTRGG